MGGVGKQALAGRDHSASAAIDFWRIAVRESLLVLIDRQIDQSVPGGAGTDNLRALASAMPLMVPAARKRSPVR